MSKTLTLEQLSQYEHDGVLFPILVLSADEVSVFRAAIEELEARLGGTPKPQQLSQCHLHFRWAYDLATHPAVLDAVEDILGPNILVHSTTIFCKHPHDLGYVSWHQDGYYLGLSASHFISAWIALSDSTVDNGCLRVIPASQHHGLPHAASATSPHNLLGSGLEVASEVDETQARDVLLRAGEMSLHHVNIIHGSNPNRADTKRIGFAVRYITPDVTQVPAHHCVVLARGWDNYHHFTLLQALPPSSIATGLVAQAEFTLWLRTLRASQGRLDG
jgi:hypothetical protein